MKERPILFSAPMVRAILDGRKTQTRRIVNKKHLQFLANITGNFLNGKWNQRPLPYGKPGDRLWVRETFGIGYDDGCGGYSAIPWTGSDPQKNGKVFYRADFNENPHDAKLPWKPSIHMPRWASRTTLEIISVRVERLQDISENDAIAEGVDGENEATKIGAEWYEKPKRAYRRLWEQINGQGSWDLNPFVWVVEFKVLDRKK